MQQAIKNSVLAIGFFAVICAAIIAVTQVVTRERIIQNEQEQKARVLYEIIPRNLIDKSPTESELLLPDAGQLGHLKDTDKAGVPVIGYQVQQEGKPKGVILPVISHEGYNGNIYMMVGIWSDGKIAGVRVLSHKETPGLGDKVELKKSDWVLSFNGKSKKGKQDPYWAVKKDGGGFDQFTGATVTPRTIVNSVSSTLDYFAEHKESLLLEIEQNTTDKGNKI